MPPGSAGDGKLISSANPVDEWVFTSPALDYGGITAVSVRSGLTVFAGATVYQAEGQAVYPKTWKTDDLGLGCGQPGGQAYTPQVAGLTITGQGSPTAAAVVLATAIPQAFARWGSLYEVVVLSWRKEDSPYGGRISRSESVVLMNAGWLDEKIEHTSPAADSKQV
jgi:hypothetical protein